MPKTSAGLLVHRVRDGEREVLLVHPGGPYWKNKDDGAWSIPKGEVEEGEEPLAVAVREFGEELGVEPPDVASATPLGEVRQAGGKRVFAWALEADFDADEIESNTFEMEWPPRSGRTAEFPEVDRAAWFGLDEAKRKLIPGQRPLLDRLEPSAAD